MAATEAIARAVDEAKGSELPVSPKKSKFTQQLLIG
jgi:hypothetical protein